MKFKKGFTLVELLVVMAITAILTAVLIPSLFSSKSKGRDTRRVSDLAQIQLALELYQDNNGGLYPARINNGSLNGYLNPIPKDPANALDYHYAGLSTAVGGECSNYHLGASLENTSSALSSDRDATASVNVCIDTGNVTSLADFNGSNDNAKCNAAVADTGAKCYDLSP